MSLKIPDSGIKVGSVLPTERTDLLLTLASDVYSIRAVATIFGAPFNVKIL